MVLCFFPLRIVGQMNSDMNEKLKELEENTKVLSEIRNGYFQTIDTLFHAIDKKKVGKDNYKDLKKDLKAFAKEQKKYDVKLEEQINLYHNNESVEKLKEYLLTLKNSMESIVKMMELLVEMENVSDSSRGS